MKHKHHIIPKHMGGTDNLENLIELSVEEHSHAHLRLYEQYGKKEDLCAYYMLSGKSQDPEFKKLVCSLGGIGSYKKRKELGIAHLPFFGKDLTPNEKREICSKGGKNQGKRNAESGHMREIQKLSDPSAAGKKGGATTISRGRGAFGDPVERKKVASLGGKIQGKINGESGHCKKIVQQYWEKVKSGEIIRTKKMWITNDIENKLIVCGEKIDDGWRKGKTQTKKI
jgi:hypothetical protein